MSVTSLSNKVTYIGDGATVAFPFSFPVQLATDLQVWITDAAGNQTEIFTNFQVDLVNSRVLYPTTGSPLAADGSKITLARVLPLTQETVLTDTGPLPATVIENALDKLTQITQQIMEVVGRTLTLPIAEMPIDFNTLVAEIEAAAGNAAAATASAAAAAASVASLGTPIPISKGGTNSTTGLVNGKIMQSSGGKVVESTVDISVVAGVSAIPPGVSVSYRGAAAPSGWLLEDGSVISQATFPGLFAAIGTLYNTGSEGAGNFRLPDSRGRADVGAGTGAGLTARTVAQTFGEETHMLTTQEMPTHGHGINDFGHAHLYGKSVPNINVDNTGSNRIAIFTTDGSGQGTSANTTGISIVASGNSQSHNNLQPSLVALKIIKT